MSSDLFLDYNVVSPGRMRVAVNTSASGSVSGAGTLLTATFLVKGDVGQGCDLGLDAVRAWDNTRDTALPFEMLVLVEPPGRFTVGGGRPFYVWAILGGAALLLVAVIVVVSSKRRRSRANPPLVAPPPPGAAAPARFCCHCGAAVSSTSRFCSGCGQPIG
jgi:hypothetical protein